MIRGLIFDFDGLILDTEGPDYHAWQEVYAEQGGVLSEETWLSCIGLAGDDTPFNPYMDLEAQIGRPLDRLEVRKRRHDRYVAMVEEREILPGVLDYLAEAKRLNLKLGVASSGTCDWVHGHLERLALKPHFECIRCAGDVTHTKPHPELYLTVLEVLGLRPEEAIAFEDSAHGLTAANRAGIFAVAVPNPLTRKLPLDHANLRLNSLAEMSLSQLIAHVEKEHL